MILIPFAISIAPWILTAAIIPFARGEYLEGDLYLTSFVGALSFVLTGPIAGIVLNRCNVRPFPKFFGILFLASLPVLAFEIFWYSSSIIPVFISRKAWTSADMPQFFALATIIAIVIYALYSAVIYLLAKRGFRAMIVGAVSLSCGSLAIIAKMVMN